MKQKIKNLSIAIIFFLGFFTLVNAKSKTYNSKSISTENVIDTTITINSNPKKKQTITLFLVLQ